MIVAVNGIANEFAMLKNVVSWVFQHIGGQHLVRHQFTCTYANTQWYFHFCLMVSGSDGRGGSEKKSNE